MNRTSNARPMSDLGCRTQEAGRTVGMTPKQRDLVSLGIYAAIFVGLTFAAVAMWLGKL